MLHPVPCPSVHLSVRLRLLSLPLAHANPLTREVGEGAKGPPPRRPHSARDTTEATGSVGIRCPRPVRWPPSPRCPSPGLAGRPSLAFRCPPHTAVHHLEPLALRRPPHAAGHHLEQSDIRNNRAPRRHVRPRPVTGATENSPCGNATASLHVPGRSCGRPLLWNKCIMMSKKREISVAEQIGQRGWTYYIKTPHAVAFWSRLQSSAVISSRKMIANTPLNFGQGRFLQC